MVSARWAIVASLTALALQDVAIPAIPADLKPSVRASLTAVRSPLIDSVDAYNNEAAAFRTACATVKPGDASFAACSATYQKLSRRAATLLASKQRFAASVDTAIADSKRPCYALEAQLERDEMAMNTQRKTMARALDDLAEWEKESRQAQADAVVAGLDVVLGGAAKSLQEEAIWGDRFERALAVKEKYFGSADAWSRFRDYAHDAELATQAAEAAAAQAKNFERGKDAADYIQDGRAAATLVVQRKADADAKWRAVLENPAVKKMLDDDAKSTLGRDAAKFIAGLPKLEKFAALPITAADFAIEWGYNATKWTIAYRQIAARNSASVKDLDAVNALRRQIERTTHALNTCRVSAPK